MKKWTTAVLTLCVFILAGCVGLGMATSHLAAEASVEGTDIIFTLRGYDGESLPVLEVLGPGYESWEAEVLEAGAPSRTGKVVTLAVSAKERMHYRAVEELQYRWHLDNGEVVEGQLRYVDPHLAHLDWELTRTDSFTIYHAVPLEPGEVEAWEDAWRNVKEWSAAEWSDPIVVWFLPETSTISNWLGLSPAMTPGGFWNHFIERMVITQLSGWQERVTFLAHELAHAVGPHDGPQWYSEGFGVLVEQRQAREMDINTRMTRMYEYGLQRIQVSARERPYHPSQAGLGRNAWDNPYSVGAAVWLFVKHHHGDEGVWRFMTAGKEEDEIYRALESLFEKPIDEIWVEWNEYLTGPDLLEDWRNL